MSWMTPILLHSSDVSSHVREALAASMTKDPAARIESLELAARLLHRETELPCDDVRELVGLADGC